MVSECPIRQDGFYSRRGRIIVGPEGAPVNKKGTCCDGYNSPKTRRLRDEKEKWPPRMHPVYSLRNPIERMRLAICSGCITRLQTQSRSGEVLRQSRIAIVVLSFAFALLACSRSQ